jgi:Flp pilus assembly protein TadD
VARKKRKKAAGLESVTSKPVQDLPSGRLQQVLTSRWFLPIVLVILTLAVWARSFSLPMVGWDDTTYFFQDTRLTSLVPENIWKILTQSFMANYHPVTTLTFAFDRAVWNTWVPGFHITQFVFYAGGIVVLYFLCKTVLSNSLAAFVAASLYATHTSHVESVVWLASRKDVVCLFFYVSSILAYIGYTKRGKSLWRFYAASLCLAAAAMLSKGYAVVLPVVLLAYDLCFREHVKVREIVDKVPFALVALAITILTVLSQGESGALVDSQMASGIRIQALLQVFACYIGRALLPIHLSAMYAVTPAWLNPWVATVGAALAVGTIVGFIVLRRRQPPVALGIGLFVLPLATVMNVFFTLKTWMTDRYLLLPTMGTMLALAAVGMWVFNRPKIPRLVRRWVIPLTASGLVLMYAGLTVSRIEVWTSPVSLWSDTLRKQFGLVGSGPVTASELEAAPISTLPDPLVAVWLAQTYRRQGHTREADRLMTWISSRRKMFETGEEIPLAQLDIEAGNYDRALNRLRPQAETDTWLAPTALQLTGMAYEKKGELQPARKAHLKALELYRAHGRPGTPAMLELADLEFRAQGFHKAAEWYRKVREEDPTDPRGIFFLGVSLEKVGRVEEAYQLYKQTLALDKKVGPDMSFNFVDVHYQMGIALEKLGQMQESVYHFQEWLHKAPNDSRRESVRAEIRKIQSYLAR